MGQTRSGGEGVRDREGDRSQKKKGIPLIPLSIHRIECGTITRFTNFFPFSPPPSPPTVPQLFLHLSSSLFSSSILLFFSFDTFTWHTITLHPIQSITPSSSLQLVCTYPYTYTCIHARGVSHNRGHLHTHTHTPHKSQKTSSCGLCLISHSAKKSTGSSGRRAHTSTSPLLSRGSTLCMR